MKLRVECQSGNNSLPIVLDNVGSGTYNLTISNEEQLVAKQLVIK